MFTSATVVHDFQQRDKVRYKITIDITTNARKDIL